MKMIVRKILRIQIVVFVFIQLGCQQEYGGLDKIKFYESLSNNELQNIPKKDRPDLAALYDFKRTKDLSLGYPPIERLFNAKSYVEEVNAQKIAARSIDGVEWTERGPNNVGGRTRAIMFDPNDPLKKKVWAGGVAGGLWINDDITDAESSWYVVNDFLPNLAIGCIAYDPANTQTFYFGTGEGYNGGGMVRGAGIWKSEDAGASWSRLPSTETDFDYVQKIGITANGAILAAVRGFSGGSGVQRSVDGGASWTRVIASAGVDIEVAGDIVYASTFNGEVYKSNDDGETWTDIAPVTTGERIEIGVSETNPNIVYVVGEENNDAAWLYRSTNAGDSWVAATIPNYYNQDCTLSDQPFTRQQGWFDLIIGVYPENPNTLFMGGIDLYRSDDAGVTWSLVSYWTGSCDDYVHADQHNIIFRSEHPDELISANDGGIFYVDDITVPMDEGGPVFRSRNKDYNVTQYYSCAIANEVGSNIMLAGAQDNGSHQFRDYGINGIIEVTGGDGAFVFIDQEDSDIQITSYVFNNYYLSVDGFNDFISFGTGDNGSFINPSEYDSRTKTLYASADGNTINVYSISAEDQGSVETNTRTIAIDGSSVSAIGLSVEDENTVFVGTFGGGIYRVTDINSDSPTTTALGVVPGNISSIAVGSSDDQLLATISNYGLVSVYETRDGGSTWLDKEGNLPDMPIWWALYNPQNTNQVLLATELGVWSIDDVSSESVEWSPSNDGLANVSSRHLRYRSSDGLVAVATHGRGVFTSDVFATASVADFYTDVQVSYVDKEISFFDASLKASQYTWDFGDGTQSSEVNPVHSYSASGTYDISLTVNDDSEISVTKSITVLNSLDADFTLADGGDFESNGDYFQAITVSGTGFELGQSQVTGKSGTHSGDNAWVTAPNQAVYQPYTEAYLYSPSFDFTLSGTYELEFYANYELEDDWEGFIVEYTLDGAKTWTKLGDYLDVDNWYNQNTIGTAIAFAPNTPIFSGTTNDVFEKKATDVSFLSSNNSVGFRFVFKTDPATELAGIAIDDFKITVPTVTTNNVSFAASNSNACVGENVILSNASTGTITAYNWNFGDGAIPETATGYGPHSVQYTSSGEKTITLTGATASGDIVETTAVNISEPPIDATATIDADEVCFGESANIVIESSQAGVSYVLINLGDGNQQEGEAVSGNGGDVTVISDPISASELYRIEAVSESGCSILLSETFNVVGKNKPEVEILIQSNGSFRASFGGASTYIWYLNGEVLDGVTSQSFTPTVAGNYQVAVPNGSCIGISEIVEFEVLSFDQATVSMYPNPVIDFMTVENIGKGAIIEVLSVSGKKLVEHIHDSKTAIDFRSYDSGVYLLRMSSSNDSKTIKVVKK